MAKLETLLMLLFLLDYTSPVRMAPLPFCFFPESVAGRRNCSFVLMRDQNEFCFRSLQSAARRIRLPGRLQPSGGRERKFFALVTMRAA